MAESSRRSPSPDGARKGDPLVARVAESVARRGDALGVVAVDGTLTYRALAGRAAEIAERLVAARLPPGPIALGFGEELALLPSLLGVLQAGRAYVPIDPRAPEPRRQALMAGAAALLDGDGLRPLDGARPLGDDIAYVLYTSGTTGAPRPVRQSRAHVLQLMEVFARRLEPADGLAMVCSASSDAHVMDVFGALFSGATLHICPVAEVGAAGLVAALERGGISVLHATPTVLRDLVAELAGRKIAGVRLVILGGEDAFGADAAAVRSVFGAGVTLVNGLGLTECSLVLQHELRPGEPVPAPTEPLPVGRPVDGVEIRLMTLAGEMRAPWGEGELEIRGPLAEAEGVGELYRTGDLLLRTPDGVLLFGGRLDFQTKIRGHRVHPAELETVLRQLDGVTDAAVVTYGGAIDRALAAFVVSRGPTTDELRAKLRGLVPRHLEPARLEVVDALPRTTTGKIDRTELLSKAYAPSARRDVPASIAARTIARMFGEVLGCPAGVDDDFFALGGHSLLAVRLVARLGRVFGPGVSLRSLFDAPTPRSLAAALPPKAVPPPIAVSEPGPAPLSSAQRGLWFLDRLGAGSAWYAISFALRLDKPVDVAALRRALGEVMRRQQILQVSFVEEHGELVQKPGVVDVPLSVGLCEPAPFDLGRGPLWRAMLDGDTLICVFHHAIFDRASVDIFRRELDRARKGAPAVELPLQYRDYARWERARAESPAAATVLADWRTTLTGAPTLLGLPTDRPRPAVESHRGALASHHMSAVEVEAARRLARDSGASLFMVLLAVFETLLHRYSGERTVLVGVPFANRAQPELEELIGYFVHTLPVRADFAGQPTFRRLLSQVRHTALDAAERSWLPLDRLVAALNPPRSPAYAPLFQTMFQLVERQAPIAGPPFVEHPRAAADTTKLDLTVVALEEDDGGVTVWAEYASDLFDASTVERMLAAYHALVGAALSAPDIPVDELSMGGQEARLIGPATNPVCTRLLHELVTDQAARTPDALALVADQQLTYAELVRRATILAARLRAAGVGPDVLVGVLGDRNARTVVAMLAVLLAGGAWVPLDPALPPARLRWLCDDTRLRLLVVDDATRNLPELGVPVLPPDGVAEPLVPPKLDGNNLAYVIYTSGSTGRPKGIAITHRGVANNIVDLAATLGLAPGERLLAGNSLSFDVSVVDLFAGWSSGATVVLPASLRDPATVLRAAAGATVLTGVPTLLEAWLADAPPMPSLRAVLIGGERIPPSLRTRIEALAPGSRAFSIGGATEASVCSVLYDIPVADAALANLPYGHAMAHQRLYVLDRAYRPCPVGVPGELYLAGIGLARGYQRRPGWTAERFVPDPFGPPGARMYATGDRVRLRADGELEILGRLDRQIKLRGVRVELGEIEAALEECGAGTAAVILRDKRLIAFCSDGDLAEVRRRAASLLPSYLVPAQLIALQVLPRTAAGKIDRDALALREEAPAEWAPPRTPVEARLALLWCELLGVERVGAFDDFFALGGHSLLAARLVDRIAAIFGAVVPLHMVFATPTVAGLAAALTSGADLPQLQPRTDRAAWPLSRAQRRALWAHAGTPNVVHAAVIVESVIGEAPLREAFAALCERHPILRARFARHGDGWRQWLGEAAAVRIVSGADLDGAARAICAEPWSLDEPQARLCAFGGDGATHLLLSLHHAVADGATVDLLLDELCALVAGHAPKPSMLQYADFAAWEASLETSPAGATLVDWWRRHLDGAHGPMLGTPEARDRLTAARAANPAHSSPRGDRNFTLPSLGHAAARAATTPFLLALGATLGTAAELVAQEDLTVIVPWSRRDRRELAGVIGPLAQGVVVRARVDNVAESWRASLEHAALFGSFIDANRFRFKVNYLPSSVQPGRRPWPILEPRSDEPFWDAGVTFSETNGALAGRFTYNRDLLDESEARRWCDGIVARLAR
jgi:amino acid adenylation domain-containing protein